jgi:hypothetical protein
MKKSELLEEIKNIDAECFGLQLMGGFDILDTTDLSDLVRRLCEVNRILVAAANSTALAGQKWE